MPECENCHYKAVPRDDILKKQLESRMNRIVGQMNGMMTMIDENRYCGDVLIQLAAIEKALQSVGYLILSDHMNSCVTQQVKDGEPRAMDELLELVRKLK